MRFFKKVALILIATLLVVPSYARRKTIFKTGSLKRKLPKIEITVLDVKQGDSIVVITPNKKVVLIDAGDGNNPFRRFDAGKDVILPFLRKKKITQIDAFIVTHPHADHIGGAVYVLKNFPNVKAYYDCGMFYASQTMEDVLLFLSEKGIKYKNLKEGDILNIDPDVEFLVFNPPKVLFKGTHSDPNNNSVVLKIKYKKFSMLLTGDTEIEAEEHLLEKGYDISADVYKVPHHGSKTGALEEFIKRINPKFAIISVARKNRFGLPDPEGLEILTKHGIPFARTDANGNITVLSDGYNFRVVVDRKADERALMYCPD